MSKKILSLALAVIMLFSVCAVAASAVQGDGTETIALVIESDAKVGAPAGTIVNITYSLDLPVDELQMTIGNIAIGYNSAKYKLNVSDGATIGDEARTWGDNFGQYMKSTASVGINEKAVNAVVGSFNANDEAKGWDTGLQVQMVYDGVNAKANTGFPVGDGETIFTLQFVALDTLTADDVIGVVEGAYNTRTFKVCYFNGTTTAKAYPVEQIDMTRAAAVAPKAATKAQVYELSAPRKHAVGDKYTVAAFFAFDAATIAPEFVNGKSQFIKGITATVTATSGGQSITVTPDEINYVYDINKDGTVYGFRVIMKNVPADAEITIVPAVTTDGTAYTVDTLNFNVADVTAY